MTEQEKLQHYDALINVTLTNIFTLSKRHRKIVLRNFNRKNKEHLFVFRVALMAREMFDLPLYLEDCTIDWIILNWRIRKKEKFVWLTTEYEGYAVDVPALLDFERKDGISNLGQDFTFGDIYDAYYEGSLN